MDSHQVQLDHIGSAQTFTSDPAPDPISLAEDRATQLVNNLTSQATDQLRQFRDDTDALMLGLQKNERLLISAIEEHAQRVGSVIESKVIMAEQMKKLQELFAPVTPVLTQLNGGAK